MSDIRDGNSYTIAKLPNGNCWMTQNMRLGSSNKTIELTPADSDVSANWTLPIAQTSGNTSWGGAANTGLERHIYATGNVSYGNYYNWYTATTGSGKSDGVNVSADATVSICPKGWRLPDGGQSTTTSFFALDKALGGNGSNRTDVSQRNKFITSPYSFSYSGYYYYAGGVVSQGSYAYWWSRSASTTAGQAYLFSLNADGRVYPQHSDNVGYGFSVRCLAR